jgi:uncharacterized damage-inducible protein DinB
LTDDVDTSALLIELYGRVPPLAREATDGLRAGDLTERPAANANSIAWLIWHVARVQDHHISELLETDQLWLTGPWAAGFGLPPDPTNTGYGHGPEDVASVQAAGPSVLLDYLDAADARTQSFLAGVSADDLDRVVDRRWNPPVTMGVRLVSIADDCLQHVGQAAYVRGLLGR